MRPQRLFIRADADHATGVGHVMRCLALAQACRDRNAEVTFSGRVDVPGLAARIAAEGFALLPPPEGGRQDDPTSLAALLDQAGARPGDRLVLDGYGFTVDCHRAARRRGLTLLVADDFAHLPVYEADILLNPNPAAAGLAYRLLPGTTPLLGPAYALLRREFLERRPPARVFAGPARQLLLTFGGSDPRNLGLAALDALARLGDDAPDSILVAGPANPNLESLRARAALLPGSHRVLAASPDMPGLMAAADLVVSAAGSTCFELAYFGLPALLVEAAANQRPNFQALTAAGAFAGVDGNLPDFTDTLARTIDALARDPARRERMSRKASRLVDGRGADRVAAVLFPGPPAPARPGQPQGEAL